MSDEIARQQSSYAERLRVQSDVWKREHRKQLARAEKAEADIDRLRSLLRDCVEFDLSAPSSCVMCGVMVRRSSHADGCPWPAVVEEVRDAETR